MQQNGSLVNGCIVPVRDLVLVPPRVQRLRQSRCCEPPWTRAAMTMPAAAVLVWSRRSFPIRSAGAHRVA